MPPDKILSGGILLIAISLLDLVWFARVGNMDDDEYDRLTKMAAYRRDRIILAAEVRFDETVAAIEKLRELTAEEDGPSMPAVPEAKSRGKTGKTVKAKPIKSPVVSDGPTAVIRRAIHSINLDRFTSVDIRAWAHDKLGVELPGPALSSTLNKLNEQGEVTQVQRSAGRAPAVYERVVSKQSEDEQETK